MIYAFADFEVDADTRTLRRNNVVAPVVPKAIELLLLLLEHRDRTLPAAELTQALWPEREDAEYRLNRTAQALRAALNQSEHDQGPVQLDRTGGLRFVSGVTLRVPARIGGQGTRDAPLARPFVGRTEALNTLRTALDRALKGSGTSVLVVGPAGYGKSRTMQEAIREARRSEIFTCAGEFHKDPNGPPLSGWLPILSQHLAPGSTAARHLVNIAPRELRTRLLRSLPASEAAELTGADPRSDRVERHSLLDTLATVLLDGRRKILVVEDIQWADAPSLQLLSLLASRLDRHPVLLLATLGTVSHVGLPASAAQLSEFSARATRVELNPMSLTDVSRYLAQTGGSYTARRHEIFEHTAGNPLLLVETTRWLDGRGPAASLPRTASALLGSRYQDLQPEALDVLEHAAVLGNHFDVNTLARAARLEPSRVVDALEAAVRQELVAIEHDAPRQFRFSHDVLRRSLYDSLSEERRSALHARMLGVLEDAKDPRADLCQIAHHACGALPDGSASAAVEWARRAAEAADEVYAFDSAAFWLERALEALALTATADPFQRFALLTALARAYHESGQFTRCYAALGETIDVARRHGMPGNFARAVLSLRSLGSGQEGGDGLHLRSREPIRASLFRDLEERMPALLDEAAAILSERERGLKARVLAQLAATRQEPERSETLNEAKRIARRTGNPAVEIDVLTAELVSLDDPATADASIGVATTLLGTAEAAGVPLAAWDALWRRRLGWLGLGRAAEAKQDLEALRRIARTTAHPALRASVANLHTGQCLAEGRFDHAERLLEARVFAGELAHYPFIRMVRAVLLDILMRSRAGVDPGRIDYESFVEDYDYLGPLTRTSVACALLESGQNEEARAHYDAVSAAGLEALPRNRQYLPVLAQLAVLCHALGDPTRAATLRALLAPYATRFVVSPIGLPLGSVARYLGLVEEVLGDRQEAEQRYRQAAQSNAAQGLSVHTALAHYALGRMLRSTRVPESRHRGELELREADRIAEAIGLRLDARAWIVTEG